jgi:hypothetical protein
MYIVGSYGSGSEWRKISQSTRLPICFVVLLISVLMSLILVVSNFQRFPKASWGHFFSTKQFERAQNFERGKKKSEMQSPKFRHNRSVSPEGEDGRFWCLHAEPLFALEMFGGCRETGIFRQDPTQPQAGGHIIT